MPSRPPPTFLAICALVLVLLGIRTYESLTAAVNRSPDFIVTELKVARGAPGAYTFTGRVVNRGNGRAGLNFVQLSLDVGSDDQWEVAPAPQPIGMLSPGNSTTVRWSNAGTENVFTWTADRGTHRARVCADTGDGVTPPAVRESNEKNNCKVVEFTVR